MADKFGTHADQEGRWLSPVERELLEAVRAAGGRMLEAGRYRWRITGPDGKIILNTRSRPVHRKMRYRIEVRTGLRLKLGEVVDPHES
jgi:hypothetical protein